MDALPDFVERHHSVLIEVPLRILLIVVICLVVRAVLRRAIDRLLRPLGSGTTPALLRPFKERVEQTLQLDSATLSERRRQRSLTIASLLKSATSFTIFVIGFMLVLSELRFNLAPFIAGTSIVGVALGFGAQNIVKDFLSGVFMMLEDQYGVGDTIDFEKASGTVEAVGLRTTRLRDVNGTVWYVRNGEVVRVGNKSQGFAQVVLDVPIADEDTERASQAMLKVAREMHDDPQWSELFLGEPVLQGVEELSRLENELVATVRLSVKVRPGEQWKVARELRFRIQRRLARLNIAADVNEASTTTTTVSDATPAPPAAEPENG